MIPITFDKAFAQYLLTYICTKNPEELKMECEDISKHLLTLPPKSDINLYRKQYGNLKDCLKQKLVQAVVKLDANIVYLRNQTELNAALAAKIITEKEISIYKEAFLKFTIKKREVWKCNETNECKVCHNTYKEFINKKGLCTNGDEHKPSYNWKLNPDVMKCDI